MKTPIESAVAAENAIAEHCHSLGQTYEPSRQDLSRMLTNLRHYADAHGLSFAEADYMAGCQYAQEVGK